MLKIEPCWVLQGLLKGAKIVTGDTVHTIDTVNELTVKEFIALCTEITPEDYFIALSELPSSSYPSD